MQILGNARGGGWLWQKMTAALSAVNSMWLQSRKFLTVSDNWFISRFILQNPDFINVITNVDFAKSIVFYFAISQNPVSRLRKPQKDVYSICLHSNSETSWLSEVTMSFELSSNY